MIVHGVNVEKIDGEFYLDGEKVIHPTIEDVINRFDEYNKLYFGGKLSRPTKFVDYTAYNYVGGNVAYVDDKSYLSMNLRGGVLWTEKEFKGTLIHEMIHLYIGQYHKLWKWIDSLHHASIFFPICVWLRLRYKLYIPMGAYYITKWDIPDE